MGSPTLPPPGAVKPSDPPHLTTSATNNRISFPFSFRLPFQSEASATSLVESTAEGRAIQVDDSTAEHRTSALRQINHNYPSKHRYAKSTGAQNSTYSEPVIVRSYYQAPLPPSRSTSIGGGGIVVHAVSAMTSRAGSVATGTKAARPRKNSSKDGSMLGFMAKVRGRTSSSQNCAHQEAKLPPVDAFTFQSFLDKMEEDGQATDINADLDRIAEICARSRYSLSNQYEVHHAPHGSGAEFLATARQRQSQGPTLQVITSDDEGNIKRSRRIRGIKRNSQAMGTLETIMSTSRSSDEDKSTKRSAAELAEEVRGKAARKRSDSASITQQSQPATPDRHASADEFYGNDHSPSGRRSSTTLALLDSGKPVPQSESGRCNAVLVGEPATPQPSTSVLEITTSPSKRPAQREAPLTGLPRSDVFKDLLFQQTAQADGHAPISGTASTGLLSSLTGWIPWTASETDGLGKAEVSLRGLLKSSESKNKLAEQDNS